MYFKAKFRCTKIYYHDFLYQLSPKFRLFQQRAIRCQCKVKKILEKSNLTFLFMYFRDNWDQQNSQIIFVLLTFFDILIN